MRATTIGGYCERILRVVPPDNLDDAYARSPEIVRDLLYRPGLPSDRPPSIEWVMGLAEKSAWPLPDNLVPVLAVDDESLACVVTSPIGQPPDPRHGQVVRWHLATERVERQADLLDTDVVAYIESVGEELASRTVGFNRMVDEIGPFYARVFLERERRPRTFVVRPVRLACQNVLVGMAAFTQDSTVAGLSVAVWQTCEVPHVVTHEGNRALAALTLCDAFANGGTMQIRFDRPVVLVGEDASGERIGPYRYDSHPEGTVPASLRRFGRTVSLDLGKDYPGSISPREARALFLAVTPMPDELRGRIDAATSRGELTPEGACFALMSALWRPIELDFMLATSSRTASILQGGAPWQLRGDRQAEARVSRAARMLGMFHARVDHVDHADSGSEARVVEDQRNGVRWSVETTQACVIFADFPTSTLPWCEDDRLIDASEVLVVAPRDQPTVGDADILGSMAVDGMCPALLVPMDAEIPDEVENRLKASGVAILRCPDRVGELDAAIEQALLRARRSRP